MGVVAYSGIICVYRGRFVVVRFRAPVVAATTDGMRIRVLSSVVSVSLNATIPETMPRARRITL